MHNPFRYFNNSPEVIRSAVMLYVRYPLSLRQVEDLLFERGIDICHETVRYWWRHCQIKSAWSSLPVPFWGFQGAKTGFVWLRPDKHRRRRWLNNEKILTYDFSLTMPGRRCCESVYRVFDWLVRGFYTGSVVRARIRPLWPRAMSY